MRDRHHPQRGRFGPLGTGLFLIGLGTLFLLERRGVLAADVLFSWWPGLITVVGLGQMLGAREAQRFVNGLFLIFLSAWLYACQQGVWEMSFGNSWPVLLIAAGVTKVMGGLIQARVNQGGDTR